MTVFTSYRPRGLLYASVGLLLLGGCSAGRSYKYEDAKLALAGVTSSGNVAIAVHDARPYVRSKNKSERFVGLNRGGFGEPYDVRTDSGKPLATDMCEALATSMVAKGLQVRKVDTSSADSAEQIKGKLGATSARRAILITLKEWKSDTMSRTGLSYDVSLAVIDSAGAELASSEISGEDNLGALGFSRDEAIAAAFAQRFERLFNDNGVVAALR